MNSLYNISFGFLFHFIFSLMIAMVFVDIEQGIHSLGKHKSIGFLSCIGSLDFFLLNSDSLIYPTINNTTGMN